MQGQKRSFHCIMPPEEIQLLKTLSTRRWERIWVQDGKIERRCQELPSAYNVTQILVEAGKTFEIGATSIMLEDRTEFCRVAVGQRSPDDFRLSRPPIPMLLLTGIPEDLDISVVLNQVNTIRVVKCTEPCAYNTELAGSEVILDWGILFENELGTMLVFEDEAQPWNICLTTNKPVITQLLEAATEIIAL